MRLISRVASSEWPPSSKKLSSMPTRSQPQHLGEQRAQHLLLRRARQTPRAGQAEVGRRQRLAVELAVGRQRQPVQHHERRRHHVVRQARSKMRAQRRSIGARIGARHHIGHQPLVAGHVLARDDRRLRHSRVPHQRRLDLAGLDAEAAHLHLRIRAAEELEHPVGAPARQIAGAVHPAPRRPERIGHEPLRRQPGTPEIAARQSRARDVELARDPGRHRLQATRPAHRPACSRSGGRSVERPRSANASLMVAQTVVSVGP